MAELVRRGDVAFLARKLRAVSAADVERIGRVLTALDDDDFDVRQKAKTDLSGLGAEALPWIYRALSDGVTLEQKARLHEWLNTTRSQHFTPEMRRQLRAVWVLERIGSLEARRLLRRLEGVAEADLTREARAASKRLASTGR
jgi:hypothetical protein